jgi:glycosyltransferase involved in cell wall biosynthesis
VLGRESGEVDGIADYCRLLADALRAEGDEMAIVHVGWPERGWWRALRRLAHLRAWRNERVLLQYTAYSWSRSGVPLPLLFVMRWLRAKGARVGIVYHDAAPHEGAGLIGGLRAWSQRMVMRRSAAKADPAILTIPIGAASWLPHGANAVTIPVGSNVVAADYAPPERATPRSNTVAVFGVTGGPSGLRELDDIAAAIGPLPGRVPDLRVAFFGSGTGSSEPEIRGRLPFATVDVHGVVPAATAHAILQGARAALFVRGPVTSGRTTAVAAIVAGTPVVGYRSHLAGPPIDDAGVLLVPWRRPGELAGALECLVTDESLWLSLHHRAHASTLAHFGWSAIARAYLHAFER